MKVFLLYDKEYAEAVQLAEKITSLYNGIYEFSDIKSSDVKAELLTAQILLLIAPGDEQLVSRALEEHWRFFLNEITWKRRPEGEIIIAAADDVNLKRIPYKLSKMQVVSEGRLNSLESVINSVAAKKPQVPQAHMQSAAAKNTAPTEQDKQKVRQDNGCKDDHIFTQSSAKKAEHKSAAVPPLEENKTAERTKTQSEYNKRLTELLENAELNKRSIEQNEEDDEDNDDIDEEFFEYKKSEPFKDYTKPYGSSGDNLKKVKKKGFFNVIFIIGFIVIMLIIAMQSSSGGCGI